MPFLLLRPSPPTLLTNVPPWSRRTGRNPLPRVAASKPFCRVSDCFTINGQPAPKGDRQRPKKPCLGGPARSHGKATHQVLGSALKAEHWNPINRRFLFAALFPGGQRRDSWRPARCREQRRLVMPPPYAESHLRRGLLRPKPAIPKRWRVSGTHLSRWASAILLQAFWECHDPPGQGPQAMNTGSQYPALRS